MAQLLVLKKRIIIRKQVYQDLHPPGYPKFIPPELLSLTNQSHPIIYIKTTPPSA
jgi:hypothetical protein